jgi:hypothetical protein
MEEAGWRKFMSTLRNLAGVDFGCSLVAKECAIMVIIAHFSQVGSSYFGMPVSFELRFGKYSI